MADDNADGNRDGDVDPEHRDGDVDRENRDGDDPENRNGDTEPGDDDHERTDGDQRGVPDYDAHDASTPPGAAEHDDRHPHHSASGSPDGNDSTADAAPTVDNPFAAESAGDGDGASDADVPDATIPDADAAAEADRDAPLGDLARAVRERRRDGDEPDPFEAVDVEELSEEELWAALDEGEEEEVAYEPDASAAETVSQRASAQDPRPEHVLDKRAFCQRCPFFSEPPTVECGHEGTDIVEVADAERFRVRGCPMPANEGRPTVAAGDHAVGAGDAESDVEGSSPDSDA